MQPRVGLIVVVLAACSSGETRVHLEVAADSALGLDSYQLRLGEKAALAAPLPALDVVVPDDMAGHDAALEVWGLVAGQQVAYGMASVTPRLHSTVTVSVTLAAVSCGTWCTEGDVACDHDGTVTCQMQANGCVGWSAPTACPSDAPFCSNGTCNAQCSDECATGATECDSSATVRTCGQFDSDACLDWSAPMACPDNQMCSNGTCGATTTCAHDGDGCDDGNACTTSDTCEGGACSGTPKCTTAPANADPTCAADGTCGFTCHTGYQKSGSACVALLPKHVFVTSQDYTGVLGGLAGADASCQAVAMTVGLNGVFVAWLSDSSQDATTRMTHATVPYVLVDGTVVATDWTHLTSGTLAHAIDHDEHGQAVAAPLAVWTDTDTDGTAVETNPVFDAASSCELWLEEIVGNAAYGNVGDPASAGNAWTFTGLGRNCALSAHLYCFEQ